MESEYDGTGFNHEAYGKPGYGTEAWRAESPGSEVADALSAQLADEYETDYDGAPPGDYDWVGKPAEELAVHVVSDSDIDLMLGDEGLYGLLSDEDVVIYPEGQRRSELAGGVTPAE